MNIHLCIWVLSCTQRWIQVLGLEGSDTEGSQHSQGTFDMEEWKKPTSFSGKERQFRQVEMLLLWTVCCKDLQSKETLQCTFEQVIYPGTDGKADESLKLWGSDHARNKLFSRRKVPEDVTSWSVILNKKKKICVCSSWLSFSKIFLIIVPVWSEIRKYQNVFLFRFDSAPSPKQT